MEIKRFPKNPIITPNLDARIGHNINGPSLIRVPAWLPNPLGQYYLYFAHHQGKFIRLAYADQLAGPWTVYSPGTLQLEQTACSGHIASPDVHIDHANKRLIMYYHGPVGPNAAVQMDLATERLPLRHGQWSFAATSTDGLHFTSGNEIFGPSYFRAFRWNDYVYALAMPGIFYRSRDGLTNFTDGPILFDERMRHSAVKRVDDRLYVFFSRAGDCPEHILVSEIRLTENWLEWRASEPIVVLRPETDYEGVHLPLAPSERGAIHQPASQLRDPGIFTENDRTYLLYSVAGESGIAIAEVLTIM